MNEATQREHTLLRRSFLGGMVALAACKKAAPRDAPKEGTVPLAPPDVTKNEMPQRTLGKTGVKVSLVGLGGYHIGIPKDDGEAVRIIRTAIDRGVTFLDNCWDYHDGRSEERMGQALADGYRQRAFLMTKIDGRTRRSAAEQIDQSLRRLKTDMIDLVQIHEIIRMSDPDRCFAADGCINALLEAKRAGKLRYIGFTGHKDPSIHLAMLRAADAHGFSFDTVQMPLNPMDAHYRSFEKEVLPVLVEKQIGVLGMKPLCGGKIAAKKLPNGLMIEPVECLHYAMTLPTSVVITGCESMGVLEQAISAALTFKPLDQGQIAALLMKTSDAAKNGKLEPFKTTEQHDGTKQNPQWLDTSQI
jgi:aryl-alcohol dehydrogenase-like predicted oxidoreductase